MGGWRISVIQYITLEEVHGTGIDSKLVLNCKLSVVEKESSFVTLCANSNTSAVIQVENPLGEAMKYLKLLQDHSGDSLETHLLAFEVFFRKQKHLLALQVQNVSSKGWNLASEQGQLE